MTDDRAEPEHLSLRWPGERADPPRIAGETAMLQAYLDHYRRTLELKCEGLSDDELSTRSVPPSTMSLHGLLRHLAGVERWWFRINFAGQDVPMLYYTDDEPDLDFEWHAGERASDALATWRAECDASRRVVAEAAMDDEADPVVGSERFSLRWLMLRMIAEYAQHCGHADLLRERVDGRTGA